MITSTQSKPSDVNVFGIRLKVFQVGNAFGIKKRADLEADRGLLTVLSHFTFTVDMGTVSYGFFNKSFTGGTLIIISIDDRLFIK